MTDETRWYATHPVAGFAAIREVGTDRVIFAVSAPGTEYGDPPMTDEEKTENLALAASAPELRATIERLERERDELRDWIRVANGFAWSHERECPRHADREAECTCGLHQFLSRPRPYMENLKRELAEAKRTVHVRIGDSCLTRDLVWCECGRGLSLSGKWEYCPKCGGKIDQVSYLAAVTKAEANGARLYQDEELVEQKQKAAALDALGSHLRQNQSDYVEYLAPDDASGEMWRCGISRSADAFDGTGPDLAAAIMDALKKAG